LINYGYGLLPPGFLSNIGAEANGLMGETNGIPIPEGPTHIADKFLKAFKEKYGNYPQAGGYASYVGVMMWADAVKKFGDVKKYKEINQHIATTTYRDPITEGLVKFDEDNKLPLVMIPFETLHYQVQEGELVTIYTGRGKKYLCNKFQLPPWIK
jgi:ABC-type branched-subunit amino acid transport system substrate-binding protein